MLRGSVLVLAYVAAVVVVTWLLELALWWDTGYTTYQLVSPLRNLSVSQVQALLELRGVQYTALLEKAEIVTLLQQSGPVQHGELYDRALATEAATPIEISRKEEFYEQVYEDSETVWLVEVVPGEGQHAGRSLLDDWTWHAIAPRLHHLHIHSAVLLCQYDRRFCARQGWVQPQLVLVLPPSRVDGLGVGSTGGRWGRQHQVLVAAPPLSASAVLTWLQKQVLAHVQVVQDPSTLEQVWLNTTHVTQTKTPHMVYISELLSPPLLIAALGLRLTTRIKLASYTVKKEEKEQISGLVRRCGGRPGGGVPCLAVVTPEGSVQYYGGRKGETFTHTALACYVCSLQPRMNDTFLVSLVLANLLALADFFYFLFGRMGLWRHMVHSVVKLLVYNVGVFLLWLALMALLRFPAMESLLQSGSGLLGHFSSSWLAGQLRYHWLMVDHHPRILWLSLLLFNAGLLLWRRVLRGSAAEEEEQDPNWWSVFPMDSYLVNVLFRPMSSLSRPRPSQDLDLEEGMERLIERLATPDLWLHPVIPTDYMKDLPTWRYDGWGNEDDLKSESETDADSISETENDTLLEAHTCCQDDNCRLCELWTTVKEIYVCHRCAILKRKLERQYLHYRTCDHKAHQHSTYEKLLKVCENCCRTKKAQQGEQTSRHSTRFKSSWLLSPQRLTELKWTAPAYAIEARVCAICLGRYRWSAVLCGLACGHHYHHSCITEWLLKDNHHCPTCRWPSYKTRPPSALSPASTSPHDHEE